MPEYPVSDEKLLKAFQVERGLIREIRGLHGFQKGFLDWALVLTLKTICIDPLLGFLGAVKATDRIIQDRNTNMAGSTPLTPQKKGWAYSYVPGFRNPDQEMALLTLSSQLLLNFEKTGQQTLSCCYGDSLQDKESINMVATLLLRCSLSLCIHPNCDEVW